MVRLWLMNEGGRSRGGRGDTVSLPSKCKGVLGDINQGKGEGGGGSLLK